MAEGGTRESSRSRVSSRASEGPAAAEGDETRGERAGAAAPGEEVSGEREAAKDGEETSGGGGRLRSLDKEEDADGEETKPGEREGEETGRGGVKVGGGVATFVPSSIDAIPVDN